MKKTLLACVAMAALLMPMAALAGPYNDFEAQMRDAYSDYRAALFQSNAGKEQGTEQALGAMAEKWTILADAWKDNPPPQYADDPGFGPMLSAVSAVIDDARQKVTDGDLHAAHVLLEKIRGEIGALHLRNGLMLFSDRINAYHAKMEAVLTTRYADLPGGGMERMAEDAGALEWLAADIAAHPSPNAADPAYAGLVKALQDSVSALVQALRANDPDAANAARKALKPPFSKLFLRFG